MSQIYVKTYPRLYTVYYCRSLTQIAARKHQACRHACIHDLQAILCCRLIHSDHLVDLSGSKFKIKV